MYRLYLYHNCETKYKPIGLLLTDKRVPTNTLQYCFRPDAGPYSSRIRGHTKDSIRSKLEDMDMQFDAIEAMSRNMENDYKNAKLVSYLINIDLNLVHFLQPNNIISLHADVKSKVMCYKRCALH